MKIIRAVIAGVLTLALGNAQAALFDRGGGLIYDDGLNVTWAANANINGLMNWNSAKYWAENLVYGGYSDWRLPNVAPVKITGFDYTNWGVDGTRDLGYNITSKNSEMSYLFYVDLGNNGYLSTGNIIQFVFGLTNSGPFTNFQSGQYWSGTEHAADPGNAWGFNTSLGDQEAPGKGNMLYALAVRDGDVAASPIPEPETYALMLTGLGLLGLTTRRRQQPSK